MRILVSAIWSSSSISPLPIPSRQAFLSELTLDPPQATGDLAGPCPTSHTHMVDAESRANLRLLQ